MEQLTTYRAKGKTVGLVFLFKYDLNGNLKLFEISGTTLIDAQIRWLFSPNFPATEFMMKNIWMKDKGLKEKFDVETSPADLSFDALWKLYDHKVARFHALKAFNKLKEETIIKCFVSIPIYKKYLAHSKVGQAHLATFINGQYYENEYKL